MMRTPYQTPAMHPDMVWETRYPEEQIYHQPQPVVVQQMPAPMPYRDTVYVDEWGAPVRQYVDEFDAPVRQRPVYVQAPMRRPAPVRVQRIQQQQPLYAEPPMRRRTPVRVQRSRQPVYVE